MSFSNDRRHGVAATFVDQQLKVGKVTFPLTQLVAETGLSASAALEQLDRLGSRITRVAPRTPFFLIVSPEHSIIGGPPVEWWLDDYFAWLRRPYYLGLQSAAALHGSSPQAIQVTQVMTDAPRRPVTVGRMRLEFIVKRRIARALTELAPNAYAPLRISSRATTVFDLIRFAGSIGGIGRAIETARPLVAEITPTDIAATLAAENERATAQRLGYVLEMLGREKLAAAVDRWLPRRRVLIPLERGTSPANGRIASRWRVADNSGEFAS